MKKQWIGAGICAITGTIIIHTYKQYQQWYPTYIEMMSVNYYYMMLFLSSIIICMGVGGILRKVLFGELRQVEEEHLTEELGYTISDMLLTVSIFRDKIGISYILFFIAHLYAKIASWFVRDRLDYIDQTISLPRKYHIRLISTILLLLMLSIVFMFTAFDIMRTCGVSSMLFFFLEGFLLAINVVSHIIRYGLAIIDRQNEEIWTEKTKIYFYEELIIKFLTCCGYFVFLGAVTLHYGVHFHILRDMIIATKQFYHTFIAWINYQRATTSMDSKYPLATKAELIEIDSLCIICREEMSQGHKLPCGHIFHKSCLLSWMEKQQTCPICRRSVFDYPKHQPVVVIQTDIPNEVLSNYKTIPLSPDEDFREHTLEKLDHIMKLINDLKQEITTKDSSHENS